MSSTQPASTPKFIVSFKDETTDEQIEQAKETLEKNGGKITNDFRPLLKAFAVVVQEKGLDGLKSDSVVGDKIKHIEPDGEVRIQ